MQAFLGRPRRRGHLEVCGLSGAGILLLVLTLVVLTLVSPLDRAGRGAHAATRLSASAAANHTQVTLASLTLRPVAALRARLNASGVASANALGDVRGEQVASTGDASAPLDLTFVPATSASHGVVDLAVGQDGPSGNGGDRHHHVDLDPMSTGALSTSPVRAFAPAPLHLLSLLLVAAVTLTYPD